MSRSSLTALFLGAAMMALAACGGQDAPPPAAAPADTAAAAEAADPEAAADTAAPADTAAVPDSMRVAVSDTARVTVENFAYTEQPDGARIFTGLLVNPTPEDIEQAEIIVTLLGENNRAAGNAQIPVQNVPSGQKKAFRAPVEAEGDFQRVRVRSVLVQ